MEAMKQCPICQALAFDDAKTCFGCMHDYSAGSAASAKHAMIPGIGSAAGEEGLQAPPASNSDAAKTAKAILAPEAPPAFVIQIKPERERSGLTSWTCTVDLVSA